MLKTRARKTAGISAPALAVSLAAALLLRPSHPPAAAESTPGIAEIAVFDFELDDRSAGGGIIAQDAVDTEHLKKSTDEARRMLAASGRYSVVDTGPAAGDVVSAGGVRHCNGCEGRWPSGLAPIRR